MNPLATFFKHFPKASIVVAPWDVDGTNEPLVMPWDKWVFDVLKKYNLEHKQAIYFTPCDMSSPRHLIENHERIRAWYCDIDVSGRDEVITQEEIEERKSKVLGNLWMCDALNKALEPSFIVDSRNGFHAYWLADDSETPSKALFEYIESNIVKNLGGDLKACKLVQLLRMPGFYNWKKGQKYGCTILTQLSTMKTYKDSDWIKLYGEPPVPVERQEFQKKAEAFLSEKKLLSFYSKKELQKNADDIFQRAKEMPQELALQLFSGSQVVNGEIYTFEEKKGGTHLNIRINGQGCASFIDKTKNMIFCPKGTKGSPNIIEWIKWYHDYPGAELAEILKKHLTSFKDANK